MYVFLISNNQGMALHNSYKKNPKHWSFEYSKIKKEMKNTKSVSNSHVAGKMKM